MASLLVASGLAACGCLPPSADARRHHFNCRTARGRTLLRTTHGRVYESDLAGSTDYGCLFSVNRRVDLLSGYDDMQGPRAVRLNGRFVAYVPSVDSGSGACSFANVTVRNLRNGHLVRRAYPMDAGACIPGERDDVTALVLKADGAVAWIARNPAAAELHPPPRVYAFDGPQRRLLDAGEGIDLRSLILTGSTLSWRNNGVTNTTTLK